MPTRFPDESIFHVDYEENTEAVPATCSLPAFDTSWFSCRPHCFGRRTRPNERSDYSQQQGP